MTTTLLALYRGRTVADAQLIAVTADPHLVAVVADQLLSEDPSSEDSVVRRLSAGRRGALRAIHKEASSTPHRESRFRIAEPEDGDDAAAPHSRD